VEGSTIEATSAASVTATVSYALCVSGLLSKEVEWMQRNGYGFPAPLPLSAEEEAQLREQAIATMLAHDLSIPQDVRDSLNAPGGTLPPHPVESPPGATTSSATWSRSEQPDAIVLYDDEPDADGSFLTVTILRPRRWASDRRPIVPQVLVFPDLHQADFLTPARARKLAAMLAAAANEAEALGEVSTLSEVGG
jgi:hypothetical protein